MGEQVQLTAIDSYTLEDAGHGFNCDQRPDFNPTAHLWPANALSNFSAPTFGFKNRLRPRRDLRAPQFLWRFRYKLNAYSSSLVINKSTTSTITDDTTNALIVARPTPAVPPSTRKPS